MSEITQAIAARQTQITRLQSEIQTLQRAASVVGPPAPAAAKPQPKQPKVKPKARAQGKSHRWTAAEKAAIGKRMKTYWAKRRKAKG